MFQTADEVAQALWGQFAAHPQIKSLLEKDGRTGVVSGIMRLGEKDFGLFAVAKPKTEKWLTYGKFATEKAERLANHPAHRTSAESRDEKAEKYSGAVRGTTYIVSTSGLWPDALDELFSAALLIAIGDLRVDAAVRLLTRIRNPYAQALSTLKLVGLVPAGSASNE